AALLVAASLGYGWHAFSTKTPGPQVVITNQVDTHDGPTREVHFPEMEGPIQPSQSGLAVAEPAAQGLTSQPSGIVVSAPADATAVQALQGNLEYGMGMLSQDAGPQRTLPSTLVVLPMTQPANSDTPK
ncbi:MAG TPA: hypothetical protein VGN88_10565, partial [Phycisphaerae bacterium]